MASNLPPLFLRKPLIFGIGLVALVLAAGVCPVVAADAPVALTARAGVHDDFDRLVIEGPRELAYTVSREGERVMLAFKQAANLNLRPFTDGRLTRARDFMAAGDPLAVSFTVAAKATLKDFRSGALAATVAHADQAVVAEAVFRRHAFATALEAVVIAADLVPQAKIAAQLDRVRRLRHGGIPDGSGLERRTGAQEYGRADGGQDDGGFHTPTTAALG